MRPSIPWSNNYSGSAPSSPPEVPKTNFGLLSQNPQFSLRDLSLLHNFTMSTCRTISSQRPIQKLWGTTVVQIAFKQTFLLHGILAVSALHVAFTGSEDIQSLVSCAVEHQSIALSSFQHALTRADRQQCDALFALSILTFIYTIALTRETSYTSNFYNDTDLFDFKWIRMARGIRVVLRTHFDWLKEGSLKLLVPDRTAKTEEEQGNQHMNAETDDIDSLEEIWLQNSDNELQEGEASVYAETLSHLQSTHRKVSMQLSELQAGKQHTQRTFIAVFRWLFDVPEAFIQLIEQHRPVALILLAHYASLLAQIHHMWWSEQSAQVVIKRVQALLERKWHKWIEGPLRHLNR